MSPRNNGGPAKVDSMVARPAEMSRSEAVAHLLRHLDDPAALRRNPLAAHFFSGNTGSRARLPAAEREALGRVRKLVRAAAEALRHSGRDDTRQFRAERQYAILLRCDLGRELHAKVAADLSLSLRQFYRERRTAREWVAARLAQPPESNVSVPPAHVDFDPYEFKIAHAHTLHDAGNYDAAIDLLRGLIDCVDNPARRLDVYCLLANFFIDDRRYAHAHLTLQAARECYAALAHTHVENIAELRGRLEAATAKRHWANGDIAAALDANEKAIRAFREDRFRAGNDADAQLARALIELANGHVSIGRFASAQSVLEETRRVLGDVASPPPSLQAQFLIALGFAQSNALEGMDEAVPTLRAALEIARQQRLGKEAIFAMAGLSLHAEFHGDAPTATAYIRDCLTLGESVLTPFDRSNLVLRMLELEATSDRARDAIVKAPGIRDQFPLESIGWNRAVLFSAMGSLTIGDFATAQQVSRAAADVAARKNTMRTYGAALRIYAAASEALNRHDLARPAIERAVEVLETSGSPYILLLSYETSTRITGNRGHALSAHDLRTSAFRPLQYAGTRRGLGEFVPERSLPATGGSEQG
jgi:tetratricopeptide (TPR) repeat protein